MSLATENVAARAVVVACGLCAILLGCDRSDKSPANLRETSIEELLPLNRTVALSEPDDHPVGLISDAAIGPDGSIIMVDVSMREVKVVDEDGRLTTILGSVGQGPGEYMQPISLDVSPNDSELLVADASTGRAIRYDLVDYTHDDFMINLDGPISLHGLRFVSPDTIAVSGIPGDYAHGESPKSLALYSLTDSSWTSVLPVPDRLQGKAAGGSTIKSTLTVSEDHQYATIDGHPVLYQLSHSGSKRDSLVLPSDLYPGVEFPDPNEWSGGVAALREFAQDHRWFRNLIALPTGQHVALAIDTYESEESRWLQYLAVADFKRNVVFATPQPCQCQLLAVRDSQLVLMRGTAGLGFEFEWRDLPAALTNTKVQGR